MKESEFKQLAEAPTEGFRWVAEVFLTFYPEFFDKWQEPSLAIGFTIGGQELSNGVRSGKELADLKPEDVQEMRKLLLDWANEKTP